MPRRTTTPVVLAAALLAAVPLASLMAASLYTLRVLYGSSGWLDTALLTATQTAIGTIVSFTAADSILSTISLCEAALRNHRYRELRNCIHALASKKGETTTMTMVTVLPLAAHTAILYVHGDIRSDATAPWAQAAALLAATLAAIYTLRHLITWYTGRLEKRAREAPLLVLRLD